MKKLRADGSHGICLLSFGAESFVINFTFQKYSYLHNTEP